MEKLRTTIVCLEGETLAWYYYEDGRRGFRGWSSQNDMVIFSQNDTRTVSHITSSTLLDRLFSLQTHSVREFRRQFETLTGPLQCAMLQNWCCWRPPLLMGLEKTLGLSYDFGHR